MNAYPDEDIDRARAQEEAERRYDESFLPDCENPPAMTLDDFDEMYAIESYESCQEANR